MGVLDVLKTAVGVAGKTGALQSLLSGKVDLNTLVSLFTTYYQCQGSKTAKTDASSIANQIASAVNLKSAANVTDLVSKLKTSGSADLAGTLQKAVSSVLLAKK